MFKRHCVVGLSSEWFCDACKIQTSGARKQGESSESTVLLSNQVYEVHVEG